jgi:hypothetical protein
MIDKISKTIDLGNSLLRQQTILPQEIDDFIVRSESLFQEIINGNFSDLTTDLATDGLNIKVTTINNPIIRWLYLQFIGSKKSKIYNAPFFEGSTKNDLRKQYVFYSKKKFESILMHLKNNESRK